MWAAWTLMLMSRSLLTRSLLGWEGRSLQGGASYLAGTPGPSTACLLSRCSTSLNSRLTLLLSSASSGILSAPSWPPGGCVTAGSMAMFEVTTDSQAGRPLPVTCQLITRRITRTITISSNHTNGRHQAFTLIMFRLKVQMSL